jgi:predicted N-acetyltransferase YhbS
MDDLVNKLFIRKIRIEDSDEISRIQDAITKSASKIDFRQIIREQDLKKEEASFVAEIDGSVVGYMISYLIYGGFGVEKSAWIATMGVDPKFMGLGIGQRLAEEILKVYRQKGIQNIFSSVRWDSTDLLSFFKTLGFDRSSFINLRKKLDL